MKRKLWQFFGSLGSSSVLVLLALPLQALQSTGEAGINALILHKPPYNLTGRKVALGQVEIGRPGQFGFDKVSVRNRAMPPAGLFFRDTPAKGDKNVDDHAHNVASIMVSSDKRVPGVAPGARLYSAAVGNVYPSGQPEECRSANHVALQNSGDVRAINFSFGESLEDDPRPDATLDGNALLTLCVDWSARVHNVLYVVAGNQGRGGIPIPTDNFNGINVAFTALNDGVFNKIDFANLGNEIVEVAQRMVGTERNVGSRRSIGLVAPGSKLTLLDPDGETTTASGTSFAAPHVTATVALLQEYGDRQLAKQAKQKQPTQWSLDARRQEVMKAVLLNAADKIADPGSGQFLGMNRTVLTQNNQTWLDSEAYREPDIPLSLRLGAGQLNAYRAYQQFSGGQWQPGQPVAPIGWDYRAVTSGQSASSPNQIASEVVPGTPLTSREYPIDGVLQAGSFISATLVWNRLVELQDRNGNDQYDLGESFVSKGLNDLDLYILPVDASSINEAIASSVSRIDSTEHIFATIPTTGQYKLRVQYRTQVSDPVQPYALAWWAQPIP
ncbi:MAG: S8 family serine peptidase [Cyanobacteria bacterium P01_H01_bin.121]